MIKSQKILFLLFLLILLNYSQACANDGYVLFNSNQLNISFKQVYKEECEEYIQYVKNLKLYQALERIGKKVEQKTNYKRTFCRELVDSNKNKIMFTCDFESGVKFDGFSEPRSYVRTELKIFLFKACFEGHLSTKERGVVFLFEKRF